MFNKTRVQKLVTPNCVRLLDRERKVGQVVYHGLPYGRGTLLGHGGLTHVKQAYEHQDDHGVEVRDTI